MGKGGSNSRGLASGRASVSGSGGCRKDNRGKLAMLLGYMGREGWDTFRVVKAGGALERGKRFS